MPIRRLVLSSVLITAVTASIALAQVTPRASVGGVAPQSEPSTAGHQHAAAEHNGACQRILAECRRQGFIKGQWEKDNGLWRDCFDPVMKGGEPTQNGHPVHVAVSPSDIQECRTAEHHKHQARAY